MADKGASLLRGNREQLEVLGVEDELGVLGGVLTAGDGKLLGEGVRAAEEDADLASFVARRERTEYPRPVRTAGELRDAPALGGSVVEVELASKEGAKVEGVVVAERVEERRERVELALVAADPVQVDAVYLGLERAATLLRERKREREREND